MPDTHKYSRKNILSIHRETLLMWTPKRPIIYVLIDENIFNATKEKAFSLRVIKHVT